MEKVLYVFVFATVLTVLQCLPVDQSSTASETPSTLPASIPKATQSNDDGKTPSPLIARPAVLPAVAIPSVLPATINSRQTRDTVKNGQLSRPAPGHANIQNTPLHPTNLHQNPSHSLNEPQGRHTRDTRDFQRPQPYGQQQAQYRPGNTRDFPKQNIRPQLYGGHRPVRDTEHKNIPSRKPTEPHQAAHLTKDIPKSQIDGKKPRA